MERVRVLSHLESQLPVRLVLLKPCTWNRFTAYHHSAMHLSTKSRFWAKCHLKLLQIVCLCHVILRKSGWFCAMICLLHHLICLLKDMYDDDDFRVYLPNNPCSTPSYYPVALPAVMQLPEFFNRLEPDTLFFVFYYMEVIQFSPTLKIL